MKAGEIGRSMTPSAEVALREVLRLMQARDWRGADQACRRLTARFPEFPAGWFAASHIGTALRSPAAALEAIERAVRAEPTTCGERVHRSTSTPIGDSSTKCP